MLKFRYIQRVETTRDYVPDGTPSLEPYYAIEQSGLSDDERKAVREPHKASLEALNKLIPLDYMGSAEFEFGEVPGCLRRISRVGKSYVKFELDLTGTPRAGWGFRDEVPVGEEKTVTVYGWCKAEDVEDIKAFLIDQSKGDPEHKYRLKEVTQIQDGCFGLFTYQRLGNGKQTSRTVVEPVRTTAWLDIANDWFVGKDKQQVNQLAHLLGVPIVHD